MLLASVLSARLSGLSTTSDGDLQKAGSSGAGVTLLVRSRRRRTNTIIHEWEPSWKAGLIETP